MQAARVFLPMVVLLLTFTGLVSVLYDYPKTKQMKKEITISEFTNLHEADQYESIWQYGFKLGQRMEEELEISAYKLYSFYVEVYYCTKGKLLQKLRAFTKIENLLFYKPVAADGVL